MLFKKFKIYIILFCIVTEYLHAQTVYTDGIALTIGSGLTVTIYRSGYTNQTNVTDGSIDNQGTIEITANWTNNATNNVFSTVAGTVIFNDTTTIGGSSVTAFNNITIADSLTGNPSGEIQVRGNWTNNGTFIHNSGTVIFNNTSAQSLSGTSTTTFYNLTVNKSSNNVTLSNSNTINNILTLTSGDIITTTANLLTLGTGSSISGADENSHVVGPVAKNTNSTSKFTFPTGNGTIYRTIAVTPSGTGATTYRAQYNSTGYGTYTVTGGGIDHVSTSEYWNLDRTSGTTSCKIDMYYNLTSPVYVGDLIVAHWTGTAWQSTGAATGTERNYFSGNVECNSNWNTFSPFTLGSTTSNNPLPIELLEFTAKVDDKVVRLQWKTASETNNDFFTVERFKDISIYENITIIDGAGNSSNTRSYSTTDEKPLDGTSYYRLKQTDFDGTITHSSPIPVEFNVSRFELISIKPNPVNNTTIISFNTNENDIVSIKIFNAEGQQVFVQETLTEDGTNQFNLNISDYKKGMYYLQLENSSQLIINSKIVKTDNFSYK